MIVAAEYSPTIGLGTILAVLALGTLIGFVYVGIKRGINSGWEDAAAQLKTSVEAFKLRVEFLEGQVKELTKENAELKARPNVDMLALAVEHVAQAAERTMAQVVEVEKDVAEHRKESDTRHRQADDRHLQLVRQISTLLEEHGGRLERALETRDEAIVEALMTIRSSQRGPDARTRRTDPD